jgi:hypothetical protein
VKLAAFSIATGLLASLGVVPAIAFGGFTFLCMMIMKDTA